MAKEEILAAIRRAAGVLGRAPSRGELRRITGVSHYRVLAEFATLREAVREAGLEPNPKGERIETEQLMEDWKRVEKKLGRRPSRAEYVREGRYSAGAFVARFGSWGKIEEQALTTKDTKEHKVAERSEHQSTGESGHGRPAGHKRTSHGVERKQAINESSEKALAFRWGEQIAQLPEPLVGKRRVTELVAAMIVNTLLAGSSWQLALSSWPGGELDQNGELIENGRAKSKRGVDRKGDLDPSLPVTALPFDSAQGFGLRPAAEEDDKLMRGEFPPRDIDKRRAVMGDPFDRSPMTNAPVNELGVVLLFGMVAAQMGFQVEALWGRFPDCEAKRRVAKGKWQRSRIEFEYESKNFALHGHDPKGCDVIVCWRHNWRDCPEELEVIELSRMFGRGQLADGN